MQKCHLGRSSSRTRWFPNRLISAMSDVRDLSVQWPGRPNNLCVPGKSEIMAQKREILFWLKSELPQMNSFSEKPADI